MRRLNGALASGMRPKADSSDTLGDSLTVEQRRSAVRDGLGIGLATGAYGLSFGALSSAAGLDLAQACALSLLMFTGASQFAFVAVVAAGGAPFAGTISAALLGTRNAMYGLHLSRSLRLRGLRRVAGAHVVLDESTAMSLVGGAPAVTRLRFWVSGLAILVCWNLATALGAMGAHLVSDPGVLGLDAVGPAAFVALVAPRLSDRQTRLVTTAAALVALALVPFVPPGLPALGAAAVVGLVALRAPGHGEPTRSGQAGHDDGVR